MSDTSSQPSRTAEQERQWFREELERNLDLIVARLEERILLDVERRGGRNWRGI